MLKIFLLVISVSILALVLGVDITLSNQTVGRLFISALVGFFITFLIFKFGLHYKLRALNRFCISFYYSVFEYKKMQKEPSNVKYAKSVRERSEVALAANFNPMLKSKSVKVPVALYTSDTEFLAQLRDNIQKADKMKLEAKKLSGDADKLLEDTQEILMVKDYGSKDSEKRFPTFDSMFHIQEGLEKIIVLTYGEIRENDYRQIPDYEIITNIALDNNHYFAEVYSYFNADDVSRIIFRAPFMIILVGIIGTFAGFFLALQEGGDIKSGAAVAIVSSLVALPISLMMDYINALFPDKERYLQAFNKYKLSLEILFKYENELLSSNRNRRGSDRGTPVI